jgi:hypothetical protein
MQPERFHFHINRGSALYYRTAAFSRANSTPDQGARSAVQPDADGAVDPSASPNANQKSK